jgi:hypothetical protein
MDNEDENKSVKSSEDEDTYRLNLLKDNPGLKTLTTIQS